MEKIFTESSFGDTLLQGLMRSRHNAHINRNWRSIAHPVNDTHFKCPQKLGLQIAVHLP